MNKRARLYVKLGIVFLFLFCIIYYFNSVVNPVILSVGKMKIRSLAVDAVNTAISSVVSQNNVYTNLIQITTNAQGDIVLIQANSAMINILTTQLIKVSQRELTTIGDNGVGIPIGSFTGLPLLMGKGPDIKIKLMPIGSVRCTFLSEFKSAGINQTNHKIYVNVESDVGMVLPVAQHTVTNTVQVLLCESVLVGKVPNVYFQLSHLGEMLNLVP